MLTAVSNWEGAVIVGGARYESIMDAIHGVTDESLFDSITLLPKGNPAPEGLKSSPVTDSEDTQTYRITVKGYMTKKASPEFDFMKKWNNDNPMPFRTMIGTVDKETRGMVHMTLHADIYADTITTCMKWGRPLTNPVSQYFGIGPECGGHNYVNPFDTEEELRNAVSAYRKQLQSIVWEGWIIKSAIIEKEEYHGKDN